jgi:Zn finger protein HypA/HybF involved in hydrogenase expression
MSDMIKREDAIKAVCKGCIEEFRACVHHWSCPKLNNINAIPSADRPQGEWEEKEIFHNANDNPIIEEWQSARCSVCHKYHTTPYMYYFDNFNFCPECGADMRGASDE